MRAIRLDGEEPGASSGGRARASDISTPLGQLPRAWPGHSASRVVVAGELDWRSGPTRTTTGARPSCSGLFNPVEGRLFQSRRQARRARWFGRVAHRRSQRWHRYPAGEDDLPVRHRDMRASRPTRPSEGRTQARHRGFLRSRPIHMSGSSDRHHGEDNNGMTGTASSRFALAARRTATSRSSVVVEEDLRLGSRWRRERCDRWPVRNSPSW